MRSRSPGFVLAALLTLSLASLARAGIFSWAVAGSGSTNTTVNWSPVGLPGPNDDTRFWVSGAYNVTMMSAIDTFATVSVSGSTPSFYCSDPLRVGNTFSVGGNGAATIVGGFARAGSWAVGPGSLTITGGAQAGSTIQNATDYFGNASGFSSTVTISGGASFLSHALVVPEIQGATATLTVTGHPLMKPATTLKVVYPTGNSTYQGDLVVGSQGNGDVELSNGAFIHTDGDLLIGTNGVGTLHMSKSGFGTLPIMEVLGTGYIGGNSDTSPGGQGLLAVDQGYASFTYGPIFVGDQDGGSGGTLRVGSLGTVIGMNGLIMPANGTGSLDLRGGVLQLRGRDTFYFDNYDVDLRQSTPLIVSSSIASPILSFEGGFCYIETSSPLSLAIGRGGAGMVHVGTAPDAELGVGLSINGNVVIADSLGGTGIMNADSGGVSVGGSLTAGIGNGQIQLRDGSGIVVQGATNLIGTATTGGSLIVKDAGSYASFYGLYVGGTSAGPSPGLGVAIADSGGSIGSYSPYPIRIWSGGGRLYVGSASAAYADTVDCSGELQVADGRVFPKTLHLFSGGTLHGVGHVTGRISLDDPTALLEILGTDPPNDTLTVGDSTQVGAFSSNGTVSIAQDTLEILGKGGVDLGHVVLSGGTLRLPNGGHLRAADVLEGHGRIEGNLLDDGRVTASQSSPALDLAGHLTCLTGAITGATLNVLPGGRLSARGTLAATTTLGGGLDMGPTLAPLTLSGPATVLASSSITMRIGSKASGNQDALALGNATALQGTLDLRTYWPTPPQAGDTLTVITAPSISGTFSSVTIDGQVAPGFIQAIYTPTQVRIAILKSTAGISPAPTAPVILELRMFAPDEPRGAALALDLPAAADVSAVLYDVTGREATRLYGGRLGAGRHIFPFGAAPLPSGLYFGRARVTDARGTHVLTARVLRLR